MAEKDILLRVENVMFGYGSEPVLEDINLEISRSRFMGIIGPNGAGKTTLIKIILGLIVPRQGRVLVRDNGGYAPLRQLGRRRMGIGYLPQLSEAPVRFPVTASEAVMMGRFAALGFLRRPGEADRKKVLEALERAGVSHLGKKLVGELSGGQRQRVFLARALVNDPKILILDEPMTGIDPTAEGDAYELIDRLIRDLGLSVVMVTHDIGAVAQRVDDVVCLNRRLFCHGNPERVLSDQIIQDTFGKDVDLVLHKRYTHRCLEDHEHEPD